MFNSGPLKSHWKNPHKMNPAARRLESHWEASKSQKTTKESHRKNNDLWKNRNTRTLSFQLCVNSSAVSQSKCQKRPPPTTQVRWVYKLGESSKLSRLVIVSFLTSWRAKPCSWIDAGLTLFVCSTISWWTRRWLIARVANLIGHASRWTTFSSNLGWYWCVGLLMSSCITYDRRWAVFVDVWFYHLKITSLRSELARACTFVTFVLAPGSWASRQNG